MGIDVTRDRIVELAAAHAPADDRLAGSAYSSVVAVDRQILEERGSAASLVHGITDEEIACGPSFAEAWGRFLQPVLTVMPARRVTAHGALPTPISTIKA